MTCPECGGSSVQETTGHGDTVRQYECETCGDFTLNEPIPADDDD
jgi:predicted RNA-binding Zn-ribbon protein involved in translation (DUF1610 family)